MPSRKRVAKRSATNSADSVKVEPPSSPKKRKLKQEDCKAEPDIGVKRRKTKSDNASTRTVKSEHTVSESDNKQSAGDYKIKREPVIKAKMFVGAHVSAAGMYHCLYWRS